MLELNSHSHVHAPNERRGDVDTPDKTFTSGQFFREAGVTIAACLGIALLAQALVAIIGAN